jgi:hypothetical protein
VVPVVTVLIATETLLSKLPPLGLNVGASTTEVMVNVALATALSEFPALTAIAFSVVVADTVMAPA